eukprot:gene25631-33470_t
MSALLNQSTCMYAIEINESAVVDFSKAKNKVYVAAPQPQGYPGGVRLVLRPDLRNLQLVQVRQIHCQQLFDLYD